MRHGAWMVCAIVMMIPHGSAAAKFGALKVGAKAASIESQSDARELCESFLDTLVVKSPAYGLNALRPYFNMTKDAFALTKDRTIERLGGLRPSSRAPIGYELVKRENLQETVLQFTYIEKFSREAVVWTFVFFRPQNDWYLHSIDVDGDLHRLFD